jgi:hypothetical protein
MQILEGLLTEDVGKLRRRINLLAGTSQLGDAPLFSINFVSIVAHICCVKETTMRGNGSLWKILFGCKGKM